MLRLVTTEAVKMPMISKAKQVQNMTNERHLNEKNT